MRLLMGSILINSLLSNKKLVTIKYLIKLIWYSSARNGIHVFNSMHVLI